jgi:hypothetical protein
MYLSDQYLATKAKLSAHLAKLGWDTGFGEQWNQKPT